MPEMEVPAPETTTLRHTGAFWLALRVVWPPWPGSAKLLKEVVPGGSLGRWAVGPLGARLLQLACAAGLARAAPHGELFGARAALVGLLPGGAAAAELLGRTPTLHLGRCGHLSLRAGDQGRGAYGAGGAEHGAFREGFESRRVRVAAARLASGVALTLGHCARGCAAVAACGHATERALPRATPLSAAVDWARLMACAGRVGRSWITRSSVEGQVVRFASHEGIS